MVLINITGPAATQNILCGCVVLSCSLLYKIMFFSLFVVTFVFWLSVIISLRATMLINMNLNLKARTAAEPVAGKN